MLDQSPANILPAALGVLPDAPDGGVDRLSLISRRAHVDAIGNPDPGTMVVSSSWLLWQELAKEGWPCIHIESFLSTADPDHLVRDIYLRANDWIYIDGEDASIFAGVSLGRKAIRETSLLMLERERLLHSLDGLVAHYRPHEIVLYDIRAETSLLDAAGRTSIVREIATKYEIELTDAIDPTHDSDPYMPIRPYYGMAETGESSTGTSQAIRAVVFRVISALSGLRKLLGDRRPGILFMSNQLSSTALLEEFNGHKAAPVVPIDWLPGKTRPGFLLRCILKGVRMPLADETVLGPEDAAQIDRIVARYRAAWQEPAGEKEASCSTLCGKSDLRQRSVTRDCLGVPSRSTATVSKRHSIDILGRVTEPHGQRHDGNREEALDIDRRIMARSIYSGLQARYSRL